MTKTKISISIDPQQIIWIENKINDKTYANISHAIENAIQQQINKDKNEKKK